MTTVNTTAKTLQEGITNMMNGAKEDYAKWSDNGTDMSAYTKEQLAKWDDSISIREGKKYIKVVKDYGVFCFISKIDFKHFKKGDILKAAGFNAPALNQPRGNVLTGNYAIRWTGPLYL